MSGVLGIENVPYKASDINAYAARELVESQLDYSNAKADFFVGQLDTAITHLGDAQSFVPDFGPLEDPLGNLKKRPLNLILPALPNAPDLTVKLNNKWPVWAEGDPHIRTVDPSVPYDDPIAPNPLDQSFIYTAGEYSSDLIEPLQKALLKDLVEGGTGFTEMAYDAVLSRESESRRKINNRRRVAVDRICGAGSLMPCGFTTELKLQVEEDIFRADKDSLHAVLIKDFEITDQNTRLTKELITRLEEMLRSHYINEENLLFNIASTTKEIVLKIYDFNLQKYLADWEGVKLKLEAKRLEVENIIAINKNETDVYIAKADIFDSRIKAIASENEARTDSAKAKASIYNSQVNGVVAQINALIQEVDIHLKDHLADLQTVLGKEGLKLDAFTSEQGLRANVSTATGQILAQAVASAFGMVNTAASYSGSNNHSMGHSYHLSSSQSDNVSTSL